MNNEQLYDLVKEIREEQKEQSKTMSQLEVSFVRMESLVETNTEDLKYHIKRTDILEDLHKDNAKRIEKLEAPISVRDLTKISITVISGIGVIASLVYTVLKIFGKIQ
jgi:predicted transcriptional regulator